MHPAIPHLVELQRVDHQISALRGELEAFPKRIREADAKLSGARAEVAAAKEAHGQIIAERKKFEFEVQQWKDRGIQAERSRAGRRDRTKRDRSTRDGEKETARSRYRRAGKIHCSGPGRIARSLRAHCQAPQRHGHGGGPRRTMPWLRHARSPAHSPATAHGNQRRGLPLRELRPHFVHSGTHSSGESREWLRECLVGRLDESLMPRRPSTPRGKGLFGDAAAELKPAPAAYRANIDGGSRGNPGPASYGVVIRDPRGELVAKLKKYVGRMTNNVAEYYGLIAALDYAQSHGVRAIRIESDSELLVKQMRGLYKVKSAELQPLFERAKKMSQAFDSFRIDHVYREQNREADALANEALDETAGGSASSPSGTRLETPSSRTEPRRIRARFRSGVLYLLEDVDLPDGTEVEILIRPLRKP